MRRRVAVYAVLLLPLLASRGAGAQSEPPSVEKQILSLETIWNEAHLRGDADALDRIWAPNLTVIVPEMQPFSKEDLLKMWRSMKVVFTRYETSDVRIRSNGGTTVVTGRLQRSRDFGGRAKEEDWLFTKTYAQVDGEWKVAAYHASTTPLP